MREIIDIVHGLRDEARHLSHERTVGTAPSPAEKLLEAAVEEITRLSERIQLLESRLPKGEPHAA